MNRKVFELLVCLAFMGDCTKSSTNPSYSPDCSGAAKSFNRDASPVIQSACVSCHTQYSSYSGITAAKAAIRSKIVDGSMPTQSSLTAAQKNSVVCWIDSGAPNN